MKSLTWILCLGLGCLLILLPLAGCTHRAAEENQGAAEGPADAAVEHFCPMHPHIARERPGSCPVCNMPFSTRKAATIKLSLDDRRLVEAQRDCPVSGGTLGYEGTPVKVVIRGQPVFLCCERCKEHALAKPEETVATVEQLKARPVK